MDDKPYTVKFEMGRHAFCLSGTWYPPSASKRITKLFCREIERVATAVREEEKRRESGAGLKPCPFCWSGKINVRQIAGSETWVAHCGACSAEGPYGDTEEEAAKGWNVRACPGEEEE